MSAPALPASTQGQPAEYASERNISTSKDVPDIQTNKTANIDPRGSLPQFASQDKIVSAQRIAIDTTNRRATPASGLVFNDESRGMHDSATDWNNERMEEERQSPHLRQKLTSTKPQGNRSYNYEDKYPEDHPGEELGANSRFFNVYLDEAEKYDDDMVRGLSGTLDALLVFATLFSAVVTTFVVDTSRALQPDQALIMSSLLFEQVQLLRANGNVTAIAAISQSRYTLDSQTHTTSDVWVNGLFFASLSLSLTTALLSVLAKQWLQGYTSVTSGSARDTALVRHLRFTGFEEWKVPHIIGLLPLILHASLGVFIAGLIVFLRALHTRLPWIIIGIAGPSFFFYLVSIILPAIYIQCPYRISVLYTPTKAVILLLQTPIHNLRHWHNGLDYRHWSCSLARILRLLFHSTSATFSSVIRFITSHIPRPSFTIPTLKNAELLIVQDKSSGRRVLSNAILWLHDMSSDNSVRQVAACSLAGEDVDYFTQSQIEEIQLSAIHLTAINPGENPWAPVVGSSPRRRATLKMAVRFRQYNLRPEDVLSQWFRAAQAGHVKELAFFFHFWEVPIDSMDANGFTAFMLATQIGNYEAAKLLLEWGANPNFVHSYNDSQRTVPNGYQGS